MSKQPGNGIFAGAVRRGLSVVATLALIFSAAANARAQSASSSTAVQSTKSVAPPLASASATAKTAANPAAASAPSGGMNTGIQIHGHWNIVVRNPDGTVAARRDFENSLTFNGAYLLQNILGGTYTPGAWAIGLGAQLSGNTGPCTGASLNIVNSTVPTPISNGNCYIAEAGEYSRVCNQSNGCVSGLTRKQLRFQTTSQTVAGPGGSELFSRVVSASGFELTGTATASSNGTIDTVATLLMVCATGIPNIDIDTLTGTETSFPLVRVSSADPISCAYVVPRGLGASVPLGLSYAFGTVFTSAILNGATVTSTPPAPVNVVANQTIQVTVVFTFN